MRFTQIQRIRSRYKFNINCTSIIRDSHRLYIALPPPTPQPHLKHTHTHTFTQGLLSESWQ